MNKIYLLIFAFFIAFSAKSVAQNEKDYPFEYSPVDTHYFVLVLPANLTNKNEVIAGIARYNVMNFPSAKLKLKNTYLMVEGKKRPFILLKKFNNAQAAMKYYNSLEKENPSFTQMGMTKEYFPISKKNFNRLLRNWNPPLYLKFFKNNYLGKN